MFFWRNSPFYTNCNGNSRVLARACCAKFATGLNIIISHSSKSIIAKMIPPVGESFWQKDSLITHILFEHMPIMIYSPVANLMHHPLVVILGFKNGHDFLQNPQLPWPPICSNFSSTFVEHQYFPSGSVSLMQVFLKVITLLEKVLVADS